MSIALKYNENSTNGYYLVTYYCYDNNCPVRTEKKPWPRSDGQLKWVDCISKKGTTYRRKKMVCVHCNKQMSGSVSASDFA